MPEKKGGPTGAVGELHADNFDARLYAKTDDHLMAEMQEVCEQHTPLHQHCTNVGTTPTLGQTNPYPTP